MTRKAHEQVLHNEVKETEVPIVRRRNLAKRIQETWTPQPPPLPVIRVEEALSFYVPSWDVILGLSTLRAGVARSKSGEDFQQIDLSCPQNALSNGEKIGAITKEIVVTTGTFIADNQNVKYSQGSMVGWSVWIISKKHETMLEKMLGLAHLT